MNVIDAPAPRAAVRAAHLAPEGTLVADLVARVPLDAAARAGVVGRAAGYVRAIRADGSLGLMESVLAEYGLSTDEGLALMTLAEALLRVPDDPTADALVADKIGPGDWAEHIGRSASMLVNGSTLGLALTGRVLAHDAAEGLVHRATRRLGAPVIRTATRAAMREMGRQFVLGQTIEEAMARARTSEARGVLHSYDMLGEAALTEADARGFHRSYAAAIAALAEGRTGGGPVRDAPGISIKLSALHPRYEWAKRDRVLAELVPRVRDLARAARAADLGLNVDAEEQDRLEISLDVIEAVLADPELAGWDGFGIVVQAYGKRALPVIDWFDHLTRAVPGRRTMVRLVKGAYWDGEVKHAQVEGLAGFPVLTAKAASDVSYLACAQALLERADRIYPQFATHNAHSIAAVLRLADAAGVGRDAFELQRLHGMGGALHDHVSGAEGVRSRIYAPVGRHRELLAYLVRRLLENGANSSFVNRLADASVPAEDVVACPFDQVDARTRLDAPSDLFAPRRNSRGWNLQDPADLAAIDAARAPHRRATWEAGEPGEEGAAARPVTAPHDPGDVVGTVREAGPADMAAALDAARPWDATGPARAAVLRRASDLYEAAHGEIFALLAREAGKTLPDAVAELREAVDFLRYYADAAEAGPQTGQGGPRGVVACISPWNFPLAIFTGQIAAALAAGNGVLAKPAEPTPLIAALGVRLMHAAGVPRTALRLLPGDGATVGAALVADPRVAGVAFTGSTATAQAIHRGMAGALDPHAMLVAETGGLNAMAIDSTALPEQAVGDLVASAFQSAGQRCSACRIAYVQADVLAPVTTMLKGAMDQLSVGDPWDRATDLGPVISAAATADFAAYVAAAAAEGRLIHRVAAAGPGHAFGPVAIRVNGIEDLPREVFGPVLHVASFPADGPGGGLDGVIDAVNARGYGLTFGLHTRIAARAAHAAARLRVGNLYVNRNQIGAVVGSQPFGGEGLSGTGPKAGGPAYVPRFAAPAPGADDADRSDEARSDEAPLSHVDLQAALDAVAVPDAALSETILPGPTGERNALRVHARGPVLCLGPGAARAAAQARAVRDAGGRAAEAGIPADPAALTTLRGLSAAMWDGDAATGRALRRALAAREGPILPLLRGSEAAMALVERHTCTDTTAAGGNASLLAGAQP